MKKDNIKCSDNWELCPKELQRMVNSKILIVEDDFIVAIDLKTLYAIYDSNIPIDLRLGEIWGFIMLKIWKFNRRNWKMH